MRRGSEAFRKARNNELLNLSVKHYILHGCVILIAIIGTGLAGFLVVLKVQRTLQIRDSEKKRRNPLFDQESKNVKQRTLVTYFDQSFRKKV